jgi:hypothetical protein
LKLRDLSTAPVARAIFETKCCGMRLQTCRKMLNWERVGLIGCFFIPALWQGYTVEPTLFCQNRGTLVNVKERTKSMFTNTVIRLKDVEYQLVA